jgi:hypothetical protein
MGRDITMTDRNLDRALPADDNDTLVTSYQPRPDDDPLAELARLIGQTDPFSPIGRSNPPASRATDFRSGRPASTAAVTPVPAAPADESKPPVSGPSWMQRRREPQISSDEPASVEPDFSRPPSFMATAAASMANRHGVPQNPAAQIEAAPAPNYPAADQPAFDLREPALDPQQLNQQTSAHHQPDRLASSQERYEDTLFGQLPPGADTSYYPEGGFSYEQGYAQGYAQNDASLDLKPRRSGMVTVAAILVLAIVGTGGAFAFRTFVGGHRSGEPPVIKADVSPTKAPAPAPDGSGKPIQDRLTGNGAEALVSREEQPAAQPASPSGPRVVLPQLNQNPNPPTPSSVSPTAKSPFPAPPPKANAVASDEPRKIKVLSIHPDQADASAQPVQPLGAPKQAARTPPQPSRPATRQVEDANASAGNSPLSLASDSQAPVRNQRVAALPPAETAGGAAGYVVQVSSQRSEADAKSSYRALQGKFPQVLGSHSPLIKRADLGAKGVYYRAMVGPFGSPDEAQHLCGSLKSAGGQCVVQRN